jgi:hypothetical protein
VFCFDKNGAVVFKKGEVILNKFARKGLALTLVATLMVAQATPTYAWGF